MYSLHVDTARTWRGGQNQALLTVLGLRTLGHRAVLVCHPDGELRRRAAEGGDLIALAPRAELDFSAAWRLSRVIAQAAPAVVHAHDPHGVAMTSLALSLGRFDRLPVFVASRRVDFPLKRNAFSRWKYRQVDAFLCASEAIRRLLLADGIAEDRAVTVHEGIDLEHVDAAEPADVHAVFWLPHQAPVVCAIGALVPHKGHRYLVEAASLVVQRVPDARFAIFGDGELRPVLEQAIRRLHLEKHVLLPGFRPDVLSLLKGCDLFVMSSVTEGLGTSLLDAMACRKAIVATEAGGIPEVVAAGETGLLVPPRHAPELAAAILALLEDDARREAMGAAGRRLVERRFSAERMVLDTLAAYERLAAAAAGAHRPAASGCTASDPSDS
jgi:glycosyltransferase involved in cell wall biosynthesis